MSFKSKFKAAWKRQRTWFLFLGVGAAVLVTLWMDPDGGLSTVLGGKAMLQGILAVAVIHLCLKWLTDYDDARGERLFPMASGTPTGAGLALIAKAIVFLALALIFGGRAFAAGPPPGFAVYGPVLKVEQQRFWPDHPNAVLLASLVEQESGCYKGSKTCWNPGARLKSAREEGAGLGQVTRAYRADGSLRFDALASLSAQYKGELAGWNWGNVYQRPDMQLRALVLMSRDAARPFRAMSGMLAFGDAAYNGGPSDLARERSACKMTPGCDPTQWFGNVELHCMKSRQPLYGNRSACDINREHVRNVMLVRAAKYEKAWAAL